MWVKPHRGFESLSLRTNVFEPLGSHTFVLVVLKGFEGYDEKMNCFIFEATPAPTEE